MKPGLVALNHCEVSSATCSFLIILSISQLAYLWEVSERTQDGGNKNRKNTFLNIKPSISI